MTVVATFLIVTGYNVCPVCRGQDTGDGLEDTSRVWKLGSQSKMMGIWNRDIVPSLIWSMLGRKREATSIKPFDQAIVDMLQQVNAYGWHRLGRGAVVIKTSVQNFS